MERVMVTLPSELLSRSDALARRLNLNRSQLVREALGRWIQALEQQEFEELLAEGYRESAEQASAFADLATFGQAAALEGTWRWDDEAP